MIFYIDEVFYQDRSVFLSGNRGVDRAYVLRALEKTEFEKGKKYKQKKRRKKV